MDKELIEGLDYTMDTNGHMEYTSAYLLRLGYCCGLECRNCPYKGIDCPDRAEQGGYYI